MLVDLGDVDPQGEAYLILNSYLKYMNFPPKFNHMKIKWII